MDKYFLEQYKTYNPPPNKPSRWRFLLRIDTILLILAAIGGVIFSASRTYTLVAEQSGSVIAAFAVWALEFSLTGLILAQSHRNKGWVMKTLRAGAAWFTILLLLLILIITNASYEIRTVDLAISEEGIKYAMVFFLGVLIPILVVINVENVATQLPQYNEEFEAAYKNYLENLKEWNETFQDSLKDSNKEKPKTVVVQEKSPASYSKEDRIEIIRELIERGETPNKSKLAQKLGVSPTTISNDIKFIELEKVESTF